jgi:hypothetical protein
LHVTSNVIARRVLSPTKQSRTKVEIASGKGQERPRNDVAKS